MKVGTIPVANDDFWICKSSKEFPEFVFHEFPMKLFSLNYVSMLCLRTNSLSMKEKLEIRDVIRRFPSIDEFESIQAKDKDQITYKVTIDDINNKTSPVRILARIKEAEVYKFISNPVKTGIQYLNVFFPKVETFEKCVKHLEEDGFQVVKNDKMFGTRTVESGKMYSEFTTLFEMMVMDKESMDSFIETIFDYNNPKIPLEEDVGFLEYIENCEILKNVIVILLDLYTMLDILKRFKGP